MAFYDNFIDALLSCSFSTSIFYSRAGVTNSSTGNTAVGYCFIACGLLLYISAVVSHIGSLVYLYIAIHKL
jgi:hypothetical protein